MAIQAVNGFTTHLPVLTACVATAKGPVVECGVGHYSTPILRAMCSVRGVPLTSLDECQEWAEAMSESYAGWHSVQHCADIPKALAEMRVVPDIVFVDNGAFRIVPLWQRTECLKVANERGVRLMVAHDTQPSHQWKYHFDTAFTWFKHQVHFNGECYRLADTYPAVPWASAMSNTDDLEWLKSALPK